MTVIEIYKRLDFFVCVYLDLKNREREREREKERERERFNRRPLKRIFYYI